ncbi:MAG: AMP-binding protein, partial [Chitinispirillia bacterium]
AKRAGTQLSFLETVLKVKNTIGFSYLPVENIIPITNENNSNILAIQSIREKIEKYKQSLHKFHPTPFKTSDTGVIIFTSGTTGAPKGIEVSWQKLVDVGITATSILKYSENDVGYVCMPVNHSNSMYLNIMPALLNSARILLRRSFSVSNFVRDIEAVGATVWNCVGDPVQYLLNYIHTNNGENADFSYLPLRTVISTGTNAANRAAFSRIFGLEIFKEVYGSTEAGAITAVDGETPDYSVGKILKDVRVINEETLQECAGAKLNKQGAICNLDLSAGEIIVNQSSLGNSSFSGYYKLPEESRKRMCLIDNQEFYRMGDMGAIITLNSVKYLIFLGRTGDWIRYKGENWAPVDGEKVIIKYKDISNVGIIGIPQSVGKEDDPMYIIEIENIGTFNMNKFLEYCKKNVPHYMFPRFIRLVTKLPMTETMKLKKSVLKRDFYFRSPQIDADKNDKLYKIVRGIAAEFGTSNYIKELAEYKDPINQDALKIFTKRSDLFDTC